MPSREPHHIGEISTIDRFTRKFGHRSITALMYVSYKAFFFFLQYSATIDFNLHNLHVISNKNSSTVTHSSVMKTRLSERANYVILFFSNEIYIIHTHATILSRDVLRDCFDEYLFKKIQRCLSNDYVRFHK